ncbi:MAG: 30S ribosomal protein S1 [Verrucomicrobiota bacterium]|nr:30S ribosomal protein S1 [Verrucomicrobiota bacterium]
MSNKTQTMQMFNDLIDVENMSSMEDLLVEEEISGDKLSEGKIVTGIVSNKRDNGALIDINYKSEGFIPKEEFENWDELKEGDSQEVFLELLEDDRDGGSPLLSVQRALMLKAWNNIIENYEEGSVVKGLVNRRIKGGLMVDIMGVEAFLPGSQIDLVPVKNMDEYIDKELELKILKINDERKNIVVSKRELLEETRKEKLKELIDDIKVDQIKKGVVKNITDFGAFIDLDGIDGLLHITDMSWGRVSHPSEMLSVGDEIDVIIIDIDYEKQRVSLGLKQKNDDPWEAVEETYPIGENIKGRVVNIMPYGAFIELEEGVEGLIHVSEMSWIKRISHPSHILSIGDEIEVKVIDIQKATKKISLSLRQITENPWLQLEKDVPVGTKITGKVRNMTSYGAFIEIQDGMDGMIHVSDMSWTRKINHPGEVLEKGDEVEVVILDISPDEQRISLGIKQLKEDPWSNIGKRLHLGDKIKGKVTKLTSFGAFVDLGDEIEGLVHISELSEEHVEKVGDVLKVDEEVEVNIIKLDVDERKIGLSLKAEVIEKAADVDSLSIEQGEHLGDLGGIFDTAMENAGNSANEVEESEGNTATIDDEEEKNEVEK